MTKFTVIAVAALTLLASPNAFAAEQIVTLAIKNMFCAACPHTVKASLQAASGARRETGVRLLQG